MSEARLSRARLEDYFYWQTADRKLLRRINDLVKVCSRDPFEGIGKPETLRSDLSGWWSRRIDDEHRFIYRVADDQLQIAQGRHHY